MHRTVCTAIAAAALFGCRQPNLTEPESQSPTGAIQLNVMVLGTTLIGSPLGGTFGFATGINDLGQVVGQSDLPGDPLPIGFLWAQGTVLPLHPHPVFETALAADVNSTGLVVGFAEDLEGSGPGGDRAVVWSQGNDALLREGLFPGFRFYAVGVNDAGQIIGGHETGRLHALFWASPDDEPVALRSLPGTFDPDDEAWGINNLGVIVGSAEDAGGVVRPVVWPSALADPVPLSGPDDASAIGVARAINDLGQIVGEIGSSPSQRHAVVWANLTSDPVPLEDFNGRRSSALAINELGQIVGWAELPPPSFEGERPVLWMPAFGTLTSYQLFDLGTLPSQQVGLVADINNNGQAVGHSGLDPRLAQLWDVPLLARLSIAPGTVKLDGKGRVTVTVLGSQWFSASGIDPASLTLGNDDGNDTPVNFKKKLTPAATLVDQNRDGFPDLVADFAEDRLIANGDLVVTDDRLVMRGRFRNGKHLWGGIGVTVTP